MKVVIIDSGICLENFLFSGENFIVFDVVIFFIDDYCLEVFDFCNNKLIVVCVVDIVEGFFVVEEEYESLLGFNGYGMYVVGIVVGNYGVMVECDGVEVEIFGVVLVVYLMVYKGLYVILVNFVFFSGVFLMLFFMFEVVFIDGVDIVNNLWGGGVGGNFNGLVYEDVFEVMYDVGVVIVFVVGNDGLGVGIIGCFGCLEDVIMVVNIIIGCLFVNEVIVEGDIILGFILVFYLVGNFVIVFDSLIIVFVVYVGEVDVVNVEGCDVFVVGVFDGVIVFISCGMCGFVIKIENVEVVGVIVVFIYNVDGCGEVLILMGGLSEV